MPSSSARPRAAPAHLPVRLAALSCLAVAGAHAAPPPVQLGPRPFHLVDRLEPGPLKERLEACAAETVEYAPKDFSIGHRGAPLQFPEHTRESYLAAARTGAGIIECDVTFTADAELVCRHAQCDLHATTNILATPLADRCSVPFAPATFGADGALETEAEARCCASDLTLAEFRTLEGKMDASDPEATSVEEYLDATPSFRTDLYATGGTLLTHAESIELIGGLGAKFTPELKEASDGFGESGLTQERYASKLVDEYVAAGVAPGDVWPQSFDLADVKHWIETVPEFGRQAVYLDDTDLDEILASPPSVDALRELKDSGVNIVAPPMPMLVTSDGEGRIVASQYARNAREAGLDIISWSVERSGRIAEDVVPVGGAYYYDTTAEALENDGDILRTIDVLAREVGVVGLFSDWPATTTFYANCLGLD